MLNGLDLFSGIGGISLALAEWVKPVAYCELDRYAQGVLLSRMSDGQIAKAPIWDDVSSLRGKDLPEIDIIYGGFPCQDISVAGLGKGLAGERSGLFFQIMRLVDEVRPSFIFLENVAAITTRGLGEVTAEITKSGYDCRWITLSAAEVGANHKRARWWLLAHSNGLRLEGLEQHTEQPRQPKASDYIFPAPQKEAFDHWFRADHGLPVPVDRIKGLGNAVVPLCAKEAFKELMGLS